MCFGVMEKTVQISATSRQTLYYVYWPMSQSDPYCYYYFFASYEKSEALDVFTYYNAQTVAFAGLDDRGEEKKTNRIVYAAANISFDFYMDKTSNVRMMRDILTGLHPVNVREYVNRRDLLRFDVTVMEQLKLVSMWSDDKIEKVRASIFVR